ncbi:hypothetical protein [Nitrospina watsonii]|uniref:Uncharacterized protein n=1 Tax=Nitrospina watsonii TaxID=1323948 RepID=A0ABN8VST2_9BACT|nr:hypothetical protein [Nitrospina watsonii]CAI2716982.1 protein of unknown function [Nitrospina watsonii]
MYHEPERSEQRAKVEHKKKVTLWGTGKPKREFFSWTTSPAVACS